MFCIASVAMETVSVLMLGACVLCTLEVLTVIGLTVKFIHVIKLKMLGPPTDCYGYQWVIVLIIDNHTQRRVIVTRAIVFLVV